MSGWNTETAARGSWSVSLEELSSQALPKAYTAWSSGLSAGNSTSACSASMVRVSVTSKGTARWKAGAEAKTIFEAMGSAQEFQLYRGSGSCSWPK